MVMKRSGTAFTKAIALVICSLAASVQAAQVVAPPKKPPPPATDPCKTTVLRFERAVASMRDIQGNKAGDALKEKLLPAKLQNEILSKDGYCGLARHIKEKRLDW